MKLATLALLGLFAATSLTACGNTWHGVGQDTENLGEEIQASSGK